MLFDCVFIVIAKNGSVVAKNSKVERTKHTRGEKKMQLQDAGSTEQTLGGNLIVIPDHPDVHVLHVHIHEGK